MEQVAARPFLLMLILRLENCICFLRCVLRGQLKIVVAVGGDTDSVVIRFSRAVGPTGAAAALVSLFLFCS